MDRLRQGTAVHLLKASRKPVRLPICAAKTAFVMYWHFTARVRRYTGGTASIHPQKGKKMAEVFAASTGYTLEAPIGLASRGRF